MKSLKLPILLAVTLLISSVATFAQSADDILNKHIEAIGGLKNWNKIKTVKLVGTMASMGNEMKITQTIANDKGWRMDMDIMGQSGYVIVTPTGGWTYMPMGGGMSKPQSIPAEQLKMYKDKMNFKSSQLIDKSEFVSITYGGKDTVEKIPCYKLNVKDKDGGDQVCFIDSKTYYMVRIERKIKIMDEEQEVAINFSDFVKQPEGITFPMKFLSQQGDVVFKTVELNKPVDDKTFKPDLN